LPVIQVSTSKTRSTEILLTSSTRMVRPSLEQRRVVVLLAEQVGAALASVVD